MLGVTPFFFIQSYVLQTFAKMVILVAAFGLFHGILVIPTFLMLLGDIRAFMTCGNESSETGNENGETGNENGETGNGNGETGNENVQAEAAENVELENLEQQAPAARNGELQNISGAVRDLTGDDGQYGPDLQPQSTYGLPGNNFSSLDHTFF